jgi:hypothetical protein
MHLLAEGFVFWGWWLVFSETGNQDLSNGINVAYWLVNFFCLHIYSLCSCLSTPYNQPLPFIFCSVFFFSWHGSRALDFRSNNRRSDNVALGKNAKRTCWLLATDNRDSAIHAMGGQMVWLQCPTFSSPHVLASVACFSCLRKKKNWWYLRVNWRGRVCVCTGRESARRRKVFFFLLFFSIFFLLCRRANKATC